MKVTSKTEMGWLTNSRWGFAQISQGPVRDTGAVQKPRSSANSQVMLVSKLAGWGRPN